ncbi:MAG: hypothetical protein J6U54_19190 [Clostridiales bacterium]|nr:hypothetical protein [Clostridiales bacterium]
MKKTTKTALIATAFALAAAGAAGAWAYAVYEYNHREPAAQDVQTHYGAPIESIAYEDLPEEVRSSI